MEFFVSSLALSPSAINPEPAVPLLEGLFKAAPRAFEALGAISLFHWCSEHPVLSLGVIFGVGWVILADKT